MSKDEFDIQMLREIESGERKLAELPAVAASSDAIARTKQMVRSELMRASHATTHRHWRTWQGIGAVAAMVAFAVGFGWREARHTSHGRDSAESIIFWPESTQQQVAKLGTMDEQLGTLETWSADSSWDINGSSLYRVFEEADQAQGSGRSGDTTKS